MSRKRRREVERLRRELWHVKFENLRDEVLELTRAEVRRRELLRAVPGVV